MRTVVTREPEWDAEGRTWMLGLSMREAAECGRCGGDLVETLDYGLTWLPEDPLVCLRCSALQAQQKKYEKHDQHAAMIFRVRKAKRRIPQKARRKRG